MNSLLLFTGLLCLGCLVQAGAPRKFVLSEFEQKVDHYNYIHNHTFKQRVVTSTKYLNEDNPPILFYCGNEGDILVFVNNTGLMWELENKLKAVLVFVEHRYYGTSFPERTSKNDYSYLSIEQALTDFAVYIDQLKNTKKFAKSPVILFGGSYGGMLASWFRIKYPHLAQGAIAASAPILQFLPYYDCTLFNKIVTKDYEGYSPQCANVIRKTWPALRRLSSLPSGFDFINSEFKTCKPINAKNVDTLIEYFAGIIINVAMTDYPNPTSFLKPMPRYPMGEICKLLPNDQLNDMELVKAFRNAFVSIYLNYTGNAPECLDLSEDSTDLGANGWEYQSCTETVMPICSNNKDDFFEPGDFNLTRIEASCQQRFNVSLDVFKVRMEYGLSDLRAATNVVFSNGERDPWSAGGVLKDNYHLFGLEKLTGNALAKTVHDYFGTFSTANLNNTIFTNGPIIINIPHAVHHEDLRETGEYDPKSLLEVRKQEVKIIRKWIRDHKALMNGEQSEGTLFHNDFD